MSLMSAGLHALADRWDTEASETDGGYTDGLRQAASELRDALLGPERLLEQMRGFELSMMRGKISMGHDRCQWVYFFQDRSRSRLTVYQVVETALIHKNDHHSDRVYCVNAMCSVHFDGPRDIHGNE